MALTDAESVKPSLRCRAAQTPAPPTHSHCDLNHNVWCIESLRRPWRRRKLRNRYTCTGSGAPGRDWTAKEAKMGFQNGLKTIVVAINPDAEKEGALEYARKLSAHYGSRIVLAHSMDPMEYATVEGVPGRVLRKMNDEARSALDKIACKLLEEKISTHSEIRQGAVAQVLVDVARQFEAGLIVIGTRGMGGV